MAVGNNIKKEFLDRQVEAFFERGRSGGLLWRHKKVLDLVLKYSKWGDNVLDVGCFDGVLLKQLERMGYRNLYGIDFSEVSRKSFLRTKIKFSSCDVEKGKIPFRKKFDVVIFSDVLGCLFSPQTVLYDIRKYLTPRGKIIFSTPNAGYFLNWILLTFLPSKLFLSTSFGPWGNVYHFTFYKVRLMARELGYRIVSLKGGKIDNYAFKSGIKRLVFDVFTLASYPLTLLLPEIFSAHIFAVYQNTGAKQKEGARFELGD